MSFLTPKNAPTSVNPVLPGGQNWCEIREIDSFNGCRTEISRPRSGDLRKDPKNTSQVLRGTSVST
jgi:hypothetical protein